MKKFKNALLYGSVIVLEVTAIIFEVVALIKIHL